MLAFILYSSVVVPFRICFRCISHTSLSHLSSFPLLHLSLLSSCLSPHLSSSLLSAEAEGNVWYFEVGVSFFFIIDVLFK